MAITPHNISRAVIAGNIRALMGRHQVSQEKLAREALGKTQPVISKRLSGEVAFDIDELLAVADYFNVEVTALFVGVGQGGSSLRCSTSRTESDETVISVTQCEGQESLLTALAA